MSDNAVLTDADLKQRVLDRLGKAAFEVASAWNTIVSDANDFAFAAVQNALIARGFTQGQALSWDSIKSYVKDLAVWHALVNGGLTKDFDPAFLDRLDRRAELATVDVVSGGLLLIPGGTALSGTRRIASGPLNTGPAGANPLPVPQPADTWTMDSKI